VTHKPIPRRPDVEETDLVGGVEVRELEIVGYDDAWPVLFAEHRTRLRHALGAADVDVEHIGSTSVPGLAAKPIIDIVVAVDDITAEEDYLLPILESGYLLRVREPGHRLVRTPARDVHVHILEKGDEAVARYLAFRDRLREDAEDRELYAATKRALIGQGFEDMNAYSDAKTDVIAAIMTRARPTSSPGRVEGLPVA
jgi:GrpB-like predicted nucleotidyltransferase (UPF0157 family)